MAEQVSIARLMNTLSNKRDAHALRKAFDAVRADLLAIQSILSPKSGSATYDAASLVDGAGATTTVTVTGAALGDFVLVSHGVDLAGITVTGWVSSADTVSVRFQNESGGTVDLASATLRAIVLPRATFQALSSLNVGA